MTPLADALIRSTLVLLAGFAAVVVLRHRSSALRHWILAATIAAAALAAPLAWMLPAWPAAALPAPAALAFDAVATAARGFGRRHAHRSADSAAAAPRYRASFPLGLIWALGFAIGAGALLVHLLRLARISARASRVTDGSLARASSTKSGAQVRHPAERSVSFRRRRPICWRRGACSDRAFSCRLRATRWDEDVIRVVVCHELAHVRRNDWAVQIAADVVRRVYWFQPLMWIACRMLRRESEQACDDVVLGTGVAAPTYASHLLQLARAGRSTYGWAAAVPMARPSTLERRIAAMLNSARNRRALSYRALVVSTLALALATFTAAAFHAEQDRSTQLTGTIYDRSGAVLPGVAVTLTDAAGRKGGGDDRRLRPIPAAGRRRREIRARGVASGIQCVPPGLRADERLRLGPRHHAAGRQAVGDGHGDGQARACHPADARARRSRRRSGSAATSRRRRRSST